MRRKENLSLSLRGYLTPEQIPVASGSQSARPPGLTTVVRCEVTVNGLTPSVLTLGGPESAPCPQHGQHLLDKVWSGREGDKHAP